MCGLNSEINDNVCMEKEFIQEFRVLKKKKTKMCTCKDLNSPGPVCMLTVQLYESIFRPTHVLFN